MKRVVVDLSSGKVREIELTPEEVAAIQPAPQPERPRFVPLDFLDLFTEAEQLAVVQATLTSAAVKLWYDRVLAATYITLNDPRVESGLDALVSAGLLSTQRKAAVMAAMEVAA